MWDKLEFGIKVSLIPVVVVALACLVEFDLFARDTLDKNVWYLSLAYCLQFGIATVIPLHWSLSILTASGIKENDTEKGNAYIREVYSALVSCLIILVIMFICIFYRFFLSSYSEMQAYNFGTLLFFQMLVVFALAMFFYQASKIRSKKA